MTFIINLLIIVAVAVIVILIANHFFFKSNVLYDKLIQAKTPAGGMALHPISSPTVAELNVGSTTTTTTTTNNTVAIGNSGTYISSSKFPSNNSNNFMMSVWIFIDEYNTNIDKNKFIASYVGVDNGSTFKSSLDLFLTPYNNNLNIGINTGGGAQTGDNYNLYSVDNIPLQKWNCITLSVNDRTMDIYLDGKLVNSYILQGFYKPYTQSELYLGNSGANSFSGYITRVRYEPNSISPQTSYNIYKEGIDSSIMGDFLNKYRLKVGFYEYDRQMTGFTL